MFIVVNPMQPIVATIIAATFPTDQSMIKARAANTIPDETEYASGLRIANSVNLLGLTICFSNLCIGYVSLTEQNS